MRIYQFIPRFTEEVERDGGAQKTLISELKRRLDVPGDNGEAEGRRYDGYDRDLSRNGAETISSVEVCEKRDAVNGKLSVEEECPSSSAVNGFDGGEKVKQRGQFGFDDGASWNDATQGMVIFDTSKEERPKPKRSSRERRVRTMSKKLWLLK
ncbi:hypothetical protein Bca52824_046159 [Brassica carinata]|uniref:Uncharacterized protein n=1 Tax=Brassica carinata TaxID=52824 RepID=A0A8X7RGP7_BRACI|nr:hypothetical protein Bca52824_046159 [Brassica carinata]